METVERRSSDRVSLFNAIRVIGKDAAGEAFSVEARTALVTLHGAAILIDRELASDTKVNIRCYGTDTEAEARVVGKIEKHPEGDLYGVQFVDPAINPWNIKFPSTGPPPLAVGRLLLQCGDCQKRELVYVDEMELEVFAANQCITRTCPACGKSTVWKTTPQEESTKGDTTGQAAGAERGNAALIPRTHNDRNYIRVRMKLRACIRHPESGEDVVECLDVSRGGLCFVSSKLYTKGAAIEAAVPYLPGQANIFTRAKIANVRLGADKEGANKYGVSYIS
ncbi:MAG TPA: PilZ domain-containing protein [Terriglobia bacterium]|nr:PilZ domain-containing protein [Terriglobia bacterium]